MSSFALPMWIAALVAVSPPDARCFPYEPDTVRVSGILARYLYYGPPGFGEDPTHDAKEVGFYLDLTAPVCTTGSGDNEPRAGVRRVQLVLDSAGYARLRPLLLQRVTLRGTLFAAFTGHHHAPVLLQVVTPVRVER